MSKDTAHTLDLVLELTVLLGEDMRASFERDGLTAARAHLLWALQERGPSTQRVLAEALRVTPRTVTGLVDGLESSGFVARRPHPVDRRATLVTFTERGARVAAQMKQGYADLAAGLFGRLPERDLDQFAATLGDVVERLRDMITRDEAARAGAAGAVAAVQR